jgi:hypothetical protein
VGKGPESASWEPLSIEHALCEKLVDYAKDYITGKIVPASEAKHYKSYTCPRPGCGGRVYLPRVVVQRPHFRHYPNEGTQACDEYHPDLGSQENPETGIKAVVEEDDSKLNLSLTQFEGVWGLGLQLPTIPIVELGDSPLAVLLDAIVEVYAGTEPQRRVSAIELKPGTRTVTVDVEPNANAFRTEPLGNWPLTVNKTRWSQECCALNQQGTCFRLRHGEWKRLVEDSGVYPGESLMLLLGNGVSIPEEVEIISSGTINANWRVKEIKLPKIVSSKVEGWLNAIRLRLIPCQWTQTFLTPPRAYTEEGTHCFWNQDSVILMLNAPGIEHSTTIMLESGSNTSIINVPASKAHASYASVSSNSLAIGRISILSNRSAATELSFIERPSHASVCELLRSTPRLRVFLGTFELVAWQQEFFEIPNVQYDLAAIKVELGHEDIRAQVRFWQAGQQYYKSGLGCTEVANTLAETIATAERIEIDAQNMGNLTILPKRTPTCELKSRSLTRRLCWYEEVTTTAALRSDGLVTSTSISLPMSTGHLRTKQVNAASLVRARISDCQRRNSRRMK